MIQKHLRSSDLFVAVFLLLITAMLLVPLPTWLLDLLLVINLSFSVILLLAGLYMGNVLALLSFPSILLLTTLFRLGLNVASTRLILSQADAGRVIQAFGDFLIRGEVVVGVIIFLIITIVNFIVVARGSARVSEVAARFALDALPGKQLAIDSDLRAGLLNPEQASERREKLRQESQLYGAMDGAMKFVQGDAIAGLFIIATNILGGMYVGLRSGLSFSEAIDTYTRLTVGDGLVNQIPAILISICAGIVVTRVSSDERASLGSDLYAQVFRRPGVIAFSGMLMVLIGLLPNVPHVPFLGVGFVLVAYAWFMWRESRRETTLPMLRSSGGLAVIPSRYDPGEAELIDESSRLVLYLDARELYALYGSAAQHYHEWWESFRGDYFSDLGLVLPPLRVRPDRSLASGGYSVQVGDAMVATGYLHVDQLMLDMHPDSAEFCGFEVFEHSVHPLWGAVVSWVSNTEKNRRLAEAGDIRLFDALEFIGLEVGSFYQRCPEETISVSHVLELQGKLEQQSPGLLNQVLDREYISVPRLTELLQGLAREGVNVRDFRQIIEHVSTYCATVGASLAQEREFDVEDITAFVRLSKRRDIISRHISDRRTLRVMTLSDEVEQVFESCHAESGFGSLPLAPEVTDMLRLGLLRVFDPLRRHGLFPVSILCRGDLRARLSHFFRGIAQVPRLVVFDELDPAVTVEPVGVWRL